MLEDLSRGGMEKEQQLKTLSQEKSELGQKSSRLEAEIEELTADWDTWARRSLSSHRRAPGLSLSLRSSLQPGTA